MSKRVLVVDDEKLIVKGIKFSLEQDEMDVEFVTQSRYQAPKGKDSYEK